VATSAKPQKQQKYKETKRLRETSIEIKHSIGLTQIRATKRNVKKAEGERAASRQITALIHVQLGVRTCRQ
jgi:hypothetical protein